MVVPKSGARGDDSRGVSSSRIRVGAMSDGRGPISHFAIGAVGFPSAIRRVGRRNPANALGVKRPARTMGLRRPGDGPRRGSPGFPSPMSGLAKMGERAPGSCDSSPPRADQDLPATRARGRQLTTVASNPRGGSRQPSGTSGPTQPVEGPTRRRFVGEKTGPEGAEG